MLLSAVSCQLSAISYQLSAISCQEKAQHELASQPLTTKFTVIAHDKTLALCVFKVTVTH